MKSIKIKKNMIPRNEIFVDPGKHTGISFFTDNSIKPLITEIKYARKRIGHTNDAIVRYLCSMYYEFDYIIITYLKNGYIINRINIENAKQWDQSSKSDAATRSGDIFKLSLLIGTYNAVALRYNIRSRLIDPQEWKGQLSKEATQMRIDRILKQKFSNEHVYDAVGMGLAQCEDVWHLKISYLEKMEADHGTSFPQESK